MPKSSSLILLLALAGCIWLASCSKSTTTPPSIIGSWAVTSIQQEGFSNGVLTIDDSVVIPLGQWVTTFQSNGYFVTLNHLGLHGGGYTLHGNTFVTVDTPSMNQLSYQILTFTEHALVIQAKDTTALIPLTTATLTETFSR
jgi:hypothetical protein